MISCELSNKLYQFVLAEITFKQLEEWLVPFLPTFLQNPNSEDAQIVAAIEMELAEWSAGIRSELESRLVLRQVLSEHVPDWASIPDPIISKSSSNKTIRGFELNWGAIPYSSINLIEGNLTSSFGI